MATLAADKPRQYGAVHVEDFTDLPVIASDILYEGSAVGLSSGNARPLVAADKFVGFVFRNVDNSAGAAGAKNVRVRRKGTVVVPITGVTGVGDHTKQVYASDDDTFTLTSAGNSKIGHIVRFISGTTCEVDFYPAET